MKTILSAFVAASLMIPTAVLAQSQGGNSATHRQDTRNGINFQTRGECERAAQRANAENKRDGIDVRNECVEEDGRFFLRTTPPTPTPS